MSQELGLVVFFVGAFLFLASMGTEIRSYFIRDDQQEKLQKTTKAGVYMRIAGIALVVIGAISMTP